MDIKNTMDQFIDKMIIESTPQLPIWNIELIKKGKASDASMWWIY